MSDGSSKYPTQHIGSTIMVVMMQVDPEDEEVFNRWYDEEHLLERLEIPGYISARRFKLEEGEGVLNYLCIWELEDASPLQSEMYKEQRARITELHRRANEVIKQRARGVYKQVYPAEGAFEDHSGFHLRLWGTTDIGLFRNCPIPVSSLPRWNTFWITGVTLPAS